MRTYVYRSVTLTSYTNGESESRRALSPFGPVKVGMTTMPARKTETEESLARLTELLNYLERQVEILENKSSKVLCTFLTGTTHLVEPSPSTTDITGTK